MSKWKCDICGQGFDNFHAQGFEGKIYCPLCYFKKENQELKSRIDKAIAYVENNRVSVTELVPGKGIVNVKQDLLEILKGESNV